MAFGMRCCPPRDPSHSPRAGDNTVRARSAAHALMRAWRLHRKVQVAGSGRPSAEATMTPPQRSPRSSPSNLQAVTSLPPPPPPGGLRGRPGAHSLHGRPICRVVKTTIERPSGSLSASRLALKSMQIKSSAPPTGPTQKSTGRAMLGLFPNMRRSSLTPTKCVRPPPSRHSTGTPQGSVPQDCTLTMYGTMYKAKDKWAHVLATF